MAGEPRGGLCWIFWHHVKTEERDCGPVSVVWWTSINCISVRVSAQPHHPLANIKPGLSSLLGLIRRSDRSQVTGLGMWANIQWVYFTKWTLQPAFWIPKSWKWRVSSGDLRKLFKLRTFSNQRTESTCIEQTTEKILSDTLSRIYQSAVRRNLGKLGITFSGYKVLLGIKITTGNITNYSGQTGIDFYQLLLPRVTFLIKSFFKKSWELR